MEAARVDKPYWEAPLPLPVVFGAVPEPDWVPRPLPLSAGGLGGVVTVLLLFGPVPVPGAVLPGAVLPGAVVLGGVVVFGVVAGGVEDGAAGCSVMGFGGVWGVGSLSGPQPTSNRPSTGADR